MVVHLHSFEIGEGRRDLQLGNSNLNCIFHYTEQQTRFAFPTPIPIWWTIMNFIWIYASTNFQRR